MNRAPFSWIPAFAALLAGTLGAVPEAGEIQVPRGPSVQMTSTHSGVLVWRTVGPTVPVVRYGVSPDALDQTVLPVQMTIRVSSDLDAPLDLPRLHANLVNTYQYEAHLSGLTEDTVYYYGIFDDDDVIAGCSEDYFLRTAPGPESERPLRFWVVGDSGDGSDAQKEGFNAAMQFVANDGKPIDAYLHLGDMAYNNGWDTEFTVKFFDIYDSLLRNTVTWPTMGNHEGYSSDGLNGIGPYYDAYVLPRSGEAGGVPSGYEGFYSFDIGPIHFVCLNSHDEERSNVGRMATWLRQDLAQNASEWLIAFWHHPPYSKGSHNSDTAGQLIEMREVMMPILEDHGLDLVLAGHSHVYERSMLIDGAYETPTIAEGVIFNDGDGRSDGDGPYRKSANLNAHEGTVAVVAGHGRRATRFGLSPVHRMSVVEAGSVMIDLEGETMTVRMLNTLGEIRDEFQIIKSGQIVPPSPLVHPWSPFGPALAAAIRKVGETDLHIYPQPPADDAVVHYTLDGSEPTTASSVYAGPLTLSEPTTIKAMSVWRAGQQRSPVSTGTVTPQGASFARTIQIPVLASDDDASETDLGLVTLAARAVGIDSEQSNQLFGLRFRDVPIPPNATITSSVIQLSPWEVGIDPAVWTIQADLSSPSQAFDAAIGNLSARPRSLGAVAWNPFSWSGIVLQNQFTPELAGLLEELVHRPEWRSGDPMTFLFSGTGDRLARSFDGTPNRSAVLFVAFDPRDPLTLAADITPRVEVVPGAGDSRSLFVSFPQLISAPQRGLSYQVEGSPDLTAGSWEPLTLTLSNFFPNPGPGWGNIRYLAQRPGGADPGEKYFVRVRVLSQ